MCNEKKGNSLPPGGEGGTKCRMRGKCFPNEDAEGFLLGLT
jgi:hypothetical protein